jgi:hypothetical protein
VNLSEFPDNVRWAREAGYDLITVNEPLAGQWRINGELGEGSRVTVVSDLRMVVSPLPTSFTAEEPLKLRVGFFEEQEKITNPDFLNVIEVSLSITSQEGKSGTKVLSGEQPPEDGTYRDTVSRLPAAGLYTFDVVADGQTFSRKFSATVGFTVPEGTEPVVQSAESPEPEITDPEPAPEQAEPETPVSEPVQSEPEPAITSPIDVSEAEEPAPTAEEPAPAPEEQEEAGTAFAVPLWMIGAAGGGLVVIGGLVWFALRQRKQRQQEQEKAAAERETLEDLQDEPEPEPVIEPEEDAEAEAIPEVTEEAPEDDMSELESVIDEHEATLKTEDEAISEEVEPTEELEEDIPVADTPVDEETAELDEDIPELEDVADPSDADAPEDDDEEEFGLEDFDLSEFDDLPDYDQDESGLPEDDPKKKPDQKDQKK